MSPIAIILAGCNGAGKTSTAPLLLRDALKVDEFVNADTIAQGLCAFAPETVAYEASQILLARVRELTSRGANLALETTLAARTYHAWIHQWHEKGYQTHLLFLALPKVEIAVERVASRVKLGGHNIPVDTIRKRYKVGLQNLFELYMPVVTTWKLYDNVIHNEPRLVAKKDADGSRQILDEAFFDDLQIKSQQHGEP